MFVCEEDHDQVVYDVSECPVCAAQAHRAKEEDKVDALEKEIDDLNVQIQTLEEEVGSLTDALAEAKGGAS